MKSIRSSGVLFSLLASAALLGACDRSERTAAGEAPVVAANDRGKVTGNEVRTEAGQVARDTRDAVGRAADTVADKTRDAAITAEVNTRLARDPELSSLAINVDTSGGQVVLRGNAPNDAARSRAAELAGTVDGVNRVSNEVMVQPRQ